MPAPNTKAQPSPINSQDKDGYTWLINRIIDCAKQKVTQEDTITEINEKNNLDFNATDKWGRTAFMCAAAFGLKDIVEFLHLNCSDINLESKQGRNALHFACAHDQAEIVNLLCRYGLNLNYSSAIYSNYRDTYR